MLLHLALSFKLCWTVSGKASFFVKGQLGNNTVLLNFTSTRQPTITTTAKTTRIKNPKKYPVKIPRKHLAVKNVTHHRHPQSVTRPTRVWIPRVYPTKPPAKKITDEQSLHNGDDGAIWGHEDRQAPQAGAPPATETQTDAYPPQKARMTPHVSDGKDFPPVFRVLVAAVGLILLFLMVHCYCRGPPPEANVYNQRIAGEYDNVYMREDSTTGRPPGNCRLPDIMEDCVQVYDEEPRSRLGTVAPRDSVVIDHQYTVNVLVDVPR